MVSSSGIAWNATTNKVARLDGINYYNAPNTFTADADSFKIDMGVALNVLDIALGALILFGLARGLMKGLFVEIASIVALILGIYGGANVMSERNKAV